MRGNKVSVLIGDRWFESIKEAEVTLGIHSLRERYNSAINRGKVPVYKGMNIYYNAPDPQIVRNTIQKTHLFGEPLIEKPITYWIGGH